jgi:hypothetical protein
MRWYVYIVTILATGILGCIALRLLGLPIRALVALRRNVLEQMLVFESITLPQPRELAVTSRQISEYNHAMRTVREVQRAFRDLGYQLLAFVENEPAAYNVLALAGLDVAEAGNRLIELARSYSELHIDRADLRLQIKKALRSTASATTSRKLSAEFLAERQRQWILRVRQPSRIRRVNLAWTPWKSRRMIPVGENDTLGRHQRAAPVEFV